MLNKDAIFKANDLQFQDIDVPEWGGTIRIGTMTGEERYQFQKFVGDGKKIPPNIMETLIVLTAKDEQGQPLFKMDDVVALSQKNSTVLARLFDIASQVNGLSQKAVEEAKNA